MAHPGRGRLNTRKAYRRHPRRERVSLLNRNGEFLCFLNDAPWMSVSKNDIQDVINYRVESRTWILPIDQLGEYVPVSKYRIRVEGDNTLWEIVNIPRVTNSTYKCSTIKMDEHDQDVP